MIEALTWGIGTNQEDALRNMRAELLKKVMDVSPPSGYGEGAQAIQLVGISGGEAWYTAWWPVNIASLPC